MFNFPRRWRLLIGLGLAFIGVLGYSALQIASATGPDVSDSAAPASASLQNPTFDNDKWYEFDLRYQGSYPSGSWLPDADVYSADKLQDWRLWFLDGADIIETDPEVTYAHNGEGVQIRPYGSGWQLGGLYQVVYDTIPCLNYQFQMYGRSFPEKDFSDAILQVGIDQVGWHPDSKNDPAVHSFPSTTEWGTSHVYKNSYGILSVTQEALAEKITVFTYADAHGGRYHRILWDTGSLQEVTPAFLYNPDNSYSTAGISNVYVTLDSNTQATVHWTTNVSALGQIFYRELPEPDVIEPGTIAMTLHLPIVQGHAQKTWDALPVDTTGGVQHQATLTGLTPGSSYEYLVAARGLDDAEEQCVTWATVEDTFTLND
jgi:hypothetical protein